MHMKEPLLCISSMQCKVKLVHTDLKGQSSKPIFLVEYKNLFVEGPLVDIPKNVGLALYLQRYSYSKINSPLSFTT